MSDESKVLKQAVCGGMILISAIHLPPIEARWVESPVWTVAGARFDVDDHAHRELRGYVTLESREVAVATTSTGMMFAAGRRFIRLL